MLAQPIIECPTPTSRFGSTSPGFPPPRRHDITHVRLQPEGLSLASCPPLTWRSLDWHRPSGASSESSFITSRPEPDLEEDAGDFATSIDASACGVSHAGFVTARATEEDAGSCEAAQLPGCVPELNASDCTAPVDEDRNSRPTCKSSRSTPMALAVATVSIALRAR
jgi:hypothetical protein